METNHDKDVSSFKADIGSMTRIALMTAAVAVAAQMAVPLPSGVPVTLQTFAIAVCGYLLGVRGGSAAICVYLLLGAVGAPVFALFTGGFMKLTGATGGFLWGFLPLAAFCGLGRDRPAVPGLMMGCTGLLLCHALGVLQFSLLTEKGFWASASMVSLPFLLKDVLSVAGGYAFAGLLKRRASFGRAGRR